MQPLLIASAVLPSLLLLWYFHSRDVNPEPAGPIAATFFLGVAIVVPVLLVGFPIAALVSGLGAPWARGGAEAFFVAAIPEESFKLLVVWRFAARRKAFDEPMDGIVYGVVASLGFATLENVLYVSSGGLSLALLRALTAVPGHAFLGAIMGAWVGRARFDGPRRSDLLAAAWLWPVLLHGLYDWPLLTLKLYGDQGITPSSTVQAGLILTTLAVLVLEGRIAVRLARRFRDEQRAALGLEPPPVTRRRIGSWVRLLGGAVLTSFGGLVLLGAAVSLSDGSATVDGDMAAVAGLFGALPVFLGVRWFRNGLRPPGWSSA